MIILGCFSGTPIFGNTQVCSDHVKANAAIVQLCKSFADFVRQMPTLKRPAIAVSETSVASPAKKPCPVSQPADEVEEKLKNTWLFCNIASET